MKNEQSSHTLPEGTVTFLFTDIESSTELLKKLGDAYANLLGDQREILRACLTKWNGKEVDTQGDAFFYSFPRATQAVSAAVEAQRAISLHDWPEGAEVRVRMGLHTGEPSTWEEGYVGMDVHRAARIAQIGHGGQVLLSETTTSLIRGELPEGVGLQDLGSHVLKDISQPEQIHQLTLVGFLSDFPPLTSLESRPNNLPVQPTPFVGRLDDLEALDALISDPHNRLVSIVGAGGMGKTRLAIAAAEQQLHTLISTNGKEEHRFPDGVFFVPCAPLETPDALVPTIGKSTGFQFYEGVDPKKQILDYFRRKRLLLLIDNFEHIKEGGTLLTDILQVAQDVKILVTSREKLNLYSEIPYLLQGMRFPEQGETRLDEKRFSSIALFLQRIRRIRPDYFPDKEELDSIGQVCRLVEGMPLGVELAAAWMELLSPGEIASEIQKSIDFLEAEKLDVPERHRSIRAVFETTWSVLSESEREILKGVSVFRGGFSIEAARKVAGATNKELLGLVNKSLLQRSSSNRLMIHELLRQYAEEVLNQSKAEKEAVRDLHCAYYADFLQEREAAIDGGDTGDALEEMDNLLIAWEWAVSGEKLPEIRKQLHSMNIMYDFQARYTEAERTFKWAADILHHGEPGGERGILYGSILSYLGFFSFRCGKEKEGIELIRKSQNILRRLEAHRELAMANQFFGFLCTPEDFPEARKQLLESIEYLSERDISWEMTYALNTLGNIEYFERNLPESEAYHRESLEISLALNNRRSIAWSTAILGLIAKEQGLYQKSKEYIEQAYDIFSAIEYWNIVGVGLLYLGEILLLLGDVVAAKQRYLQALAVYQEIGQQKEEGDCIQGLGDVAFAMGDYEQARKHYANSLEFFKDAEDLTHSGYVLGRLGLVSAVLGHDEEAKSHFCEALDVGIDTQYVPLCLSVLSRMASFLVSKGQFARALEIATLVTNHPFSRAYSREIAKKTLIESRGLVEHENIIAAEERGRKLDPLQEARVIRGELEKMS